MKRNFLAGWLLLAVASIASAQGYPAPKQGDFIIKDFNFASGETLPELRIHYRTIGEPKRDENGVVRNAVFILHGTSGSGANFLNRIFAGELFGKGQLLDATKYYIILPDNIGHGGSSKPSDGLRAKFPRYGYTDMIEAQYRLLTEGLKVNHLRLVMGTSMGGMHTWLWAGKYPDFMDAAMPLASLPIRMSGRNRMWRKMLIDSIRTDPEWQDGNYEKPPRGLKFALAMMQLVGSNPVLRQKQAPTVKKADEILERSIAGSFRRMDANDLLYAVESSFDYDPGPGLEKIKCPLVAINFADDLINPPELGILEKEITKVKYGRAIVMPMSDQTAGHGTHTRARVWKHYLEELLKESEKVAAGGE